MGRRIWNYKPTLEYPLGGEGLSARNVESWANFSPRPLPASEGSGKGDLLSLWAERYVWKVKLWRKTGLHVECSRGRRKGVCFLLP